MSGVEWGGGESSSFLRRQESSPPNPALRRCTHKAELRKIPPSGKRVQWHELFVTRIADGRIAEDWMQSDLAAELMAKVPRR